MFSPRRGRAVRIPENGGNWIRTNGPAVEETPLRCPMSVPGQRFSRRQSLRGTEGSNLLPSSGESSANLASSNAPRSTLRVCAPKKFEKRAGARSSNRAFIGSRGPDRTLAIPWGRHRVIRLASPRPNSSFPPRLGSRHHRHAARRRVYPTDW